MCISVLEHVCSVMYISIYVGCLFFVIFFCYLLWLIAANKEYALCYKNCATFLQNLWFLMTDFDNFFTVAIIDLTNHLKICHVLPLDLAKIVQ